MKRLVALSLVVVGLSCQVATAKAKDVVIIPNVMVQEGSSQFKADLVAGQVEDKGTEKTFDDLRLVTKFGRSFVLAEQSYSLGLSTPDLAFIEQWICKQVAPANWKYTSSGPASSSRIETESVVILKNGTAVVNTDKTVEAYGSRANVQCSKNPIEHVGE